MRPLYAALLFLSPLDDCTQALSQSASVPAPTAAGAHGGALVIAEGRPMELVVREDGALEIHTLMAGPSSIGADWVVSAQVPTAAGSTTIVSLRFDEADQRFEGTMPTGVGVTTGPFRVGYLDGGHAVVAEGTLSKLSAPAPTLPETEVDAGAPLADAGTPADDAGTPPAPDAGAILVDQQATEEAAPAEAVATAAAEPTDSASATPTAATATETTTTTTRATATERSTSRGFGSTRRNRR